MLQKVGVHKKRLKAYQKIITPELYEEILTLSQELKDLRVLHVNATKFGGGVAEILYSLIPLLQDLGLRAEWQTIEGDERLFNITKTFHNAFQGGNCTINREIERTYKRFNAYNAHLLQGEWDVIIIHDPQPAAIPYYISASNTKYAWRCHIDTSCPNEQMWKFFRPFLAEYDAAIFTMKEYMPHNLPIKMIKIVPPAIDPLTVKNKRIWDPGLLNQVIKSYGINPGRPLITQVSRFDKWKDPIGIIKTYNIAKKKIPDLQLALVGSMADDDPEGWITYREVEEFAGKDKNIFLLTNLGDLEINVFQARSDIILQKSTKEGFGLTVTEAMWKGTPVIGGNVGGIKLQIRNGVNGFLVNDVKECAEKIIYLLQNREELERMGKAGQETAQKRFLTPRLLRDDLVLYKNLIKTK